MKRILFLLTNLGGGGAERVLVNLVNNMDRDRFDITVQTLTSEGINAGRISPDIKRIGPKFVEFRGSSYLFRLLSARFLFGFFVGDNNYDVMIAYMHGLPTKVLAGSGNSKKTIAWLHNDMRFCLLSKFFSTKNSLLSAMDKFDRIVGVSQWVCNSFIKCCGLKNKVMTIYNTNDVEYIVAQSKLQIQDDAWESGRKWRLVSVGNLKKAKGYDRLPHILKKLCDDGLDFQLCIFGEGGHRQEIERLIEKYNLSKCMKLMGYAPNPYPYIAAADLFISASRFEGLATVLSEATILGTPSIATDVSGAKEVLGENNEYGIVVENDDEALYRGIKNLLSEPNGLTYYRSQVVKRREFFDTKTTVKMVEDLINDLAGDS